MNLPSKVPTIPIEGCISYEGWLKGRRSARNRPASAPSAPRNSPPPPPGRWHRMRAAGAGVPAARQQQQQQQQEPPRNAAAARPRGSSPQSSRRSRLVRRRRHGRRCRRRPRRTCAFPPTTAYSPPLGRERRPAPAALLPSSPPPMPPRIAAAASCRSCAWSAGAHGHPWRRRRRRRRRYWQRSGSQARLPKGRVVPWTRQPHSPPAPWLTAKGLRGSLRRLSCQRFLPRRWWQAPHGPRERATGACWLSLWLARDD